MNNPRKNKVYGLHSITVATTQFIWLSLQPAFA